MMKIRKGDNVKVMAGKDRGKTGKVIQAFPALGRVVVEGVNKAKKHMKTRKQGEKGQVIDYASPLRMEAVALVCPNCTQPTRVGVKVLEDGKRVRVCRKCNEAIE